MAQAIAQAPSRAVGDVFAPVTVVVPSNLAGLSARRLIGSGRLDGSGGLINVIGEAKECSIFGDRGNRTARRSWCKSAVERAQIHEQSADRSGD